MEMFGPLPAYHPCNTQRLVVRWELEDLTFLDIKEPFLRLTQTPLHPAFGGLSQMTKVGALLVIQQIREAAAMLMSSIPGARELFSFQRATQGCVGLRYRPSQHAFGTAEDPPQVQGPQRTGLGVEKTQELGEYPKVSTLTAPGETYPMNCELHCDLPGGTGPGGDHGIGNQMGLTLETVHVMLDLTDKLVSQPTLIDELPINVKKSQSTRRRLMHAPRTARVTQPVSTAARSSRAPKSTTISVSISANPTNFAQNRKRSISETKFGGRGAAKKQRTNTNDQEARELSNLLADNVIDKSSNVGQLLSGIK